MQIIRIDQIQNLLKTNPNDSFLLFALAKEYEKMGQIDEAIRQFEKLMKGNEGYVGLYYHLGKNYELMEQSEKALEVYRKGIKIADDQGDSHSKKELEQALYNLEIA